MPWRYRQDGGAFLLAVVMIFCGYIAIKKGFIDELPRLVISVTIIIGIVSIGLIRLYLVSVGETSLKHYSLARRYHRKHQKHFEKGNHKFAEHYRKLANKHRSRAWHLEETQGF